MGSKSRIHKINCIRNNFPRSGQTLTTKTFVLKWLEIISYFTELVSTRLRSLEFVIRYRILMTLILYKQASCQRELCGKILVLSFKNVFSRGTIYYFENPQRPIHKRYVTYQNDSVQPLKKSIVQCNVKNPV